MTFDVIIWSSYHLHGWSYRLGGTRRDYKLHLDRHWGIQHGRPITMPGLGNIKKGISSDGEMQIRQRIEKDAHLWPSSYNCFQTSFSEPLLWDDLICTAKKPYVWWIFCLSNMSRIQDWAVPRCPENANANQCKGRVKKRIATLCGMSVELLPPSRLGQVSEMRSL